MTKAINLESFGKSHLQFSPPDTLKVNLITIFAEKVGAAGSGVKTSPASSPGPSSQSLPITYANKWPVWIISSDGTMVTKLPDESDKVGWCNAITMEQLWYPIDLQPKPKCRIALGLVLKDGKPRYIFPTIETIVIREDGGAWHNRGLNSIPIAKNWIAIHTSHPLTSLEISAYYCQQSPIEVNNNDNDTSSGGVRESEDNSNNNNNNNWIRVVEPTSIERPMNMLSCMIASGPNDMGNGFCYLITPVPNSGYLDDTIVVPGNRIRIFLSSTSSNDDEESKFNLSTSHGECDMSVYNVAPAGQSPNLPAVYHPLYSK